MTLEQAMRQTLAELALLSHGKVTSYNPSGHGTADSRDPTGESHPPHLEYAARWAEDPTEGTLTAAREYLAAWKKRAAPLPDTDLPSLEEMVIEQGERFAAEQVASRFGIAPARVVRIRLKRDREAEFGLPLRPVTRAEVKDKSRDRVVHLASQGMTVRQIGTITDVPRETVRRWMKEAA